MKLVVKLTLLFALGASPAVAPPDPNHFASTYNAWVELRRQHIEGALDAHELHAWEEVKKAWPEFRRMIDAQY